MLVYFLCPRLLSVVGAEAVDMMLAFSSAHLNSKKKNIFFQDLSLVLDKEYEQVFYHQRLILDPS